MSEQTPRRVPAEDEEERGNPPPRRVVVLGSTGTIGRLTLEIARRHPERLQVAALSAGRNAELLARQAAEHGCALVAIADPSCAPALEAAGMRAAAVESPAALARDASAGDGRCGGGQEPAAQAGGAEKRRSPAAFLRGPEGVRALAGLPDVDIVVNGIVGAAGLEPTIAALERGRRVGLANKESLVLGGHLIEELLARAGGEIIPIDSEHSALWQCLRGRDAREIRRLVLTASGGPLRTLDARAIERITPEQALRHPHWNMGPRITVDSATLFNKGLEVIEARWLFGVPFARIDALVHPQAIVHGMVEFVDGSYLAHLSRPDMRLPIQLALSLPARWEPPVAPWDPVQAAPLTFEFPDETRFPCYAIARAAGESGGTAPAVANAADEELVAAFLAGRISLPAIARGLERVLRGHSRTPAPSFHEIVAADSWARTQAKAFIDDAPRP